jgi:hypothetical protein
MAQFGEVIGRWWAAWCTIVRREVPEAGGASDDAGTGAPFDRER